MKGISQSHPKLPHSLIQDYYSKYALFFGGILLQNFPAFIWQSMILLMLFFFFFAWHAVLLFCFYQTSAWIPILNFR